MYIARKERRRVHAFEWKAYDGPEVSLAMSVEAGLQYVSEKEHMFWPANRSDCVCQRNLIESQDQLR